MQLKSEKQSIFICFLIVLLAYLPVSSFLFAVKNDMFTGYFPLKYFMSASLDAGVFPLWNPYLNYGFPVYGDMSLAWWNPGTWIIALTTGYNAWTFTLELLMYLLLSVWGMHKLASLWTEDLYLRSIAAISYACCGYFVGNLQHFNWVAAAALIPLTLYLLIRYLQDGSPRYLAATTFSATWLATVAHPGLIIGSLLFTIIMVPGITGVNPSTFKRSAIAFMATAACCAGMIFGYTQVLPYTNRSGDVSMLINQAGSTSAASWISFLFSLPVNKGDWYQNDISMRNCFIGILLFSAFITSLRASANRTERYFALAGLFFLLLSSDLFISIYRHIPVLNFIRLTGELRIFALLGFILSGTISLNRQLQSGTAATLVSLKILRVVFASTILVSSVLLALHPSGSSERSGLREIAKGFIDNAEPQLLFLIHASIQFIICSALIKALKGKRTDHLFAVVAVELFIATILTLPFTGVGQRSVKDINGIYSQAPSGPVKPLNKPEKEVVAMYPEVKAITGNWALVSKQIAQDGLIPYPLVFPSTAVYFESPRVAVIREYSPFFLTSGFNAPGIEPKRFNYDRIDFTIDLQQNDTLVLKQNMFRGWKASLDGASVKILTTPDGFMAIPLKPKKNELVVSFGNKPVKALLIYQFIMMAALAALYFFLPRRVNA